MLVITKGEDRTFKFKLRNEEKDPFDLSGLTELEVEFKGGLIKQYTVSGITIDNAVLGQFSLQLDDVDTSSLQAGKNQSIKLTVIKGTDTRIKILERSLTVVENQLG